MSDSLIIAQEALVAASRRTVESCQKHADFLQGAIDKRQQEYDKLTGDIVMLKQKETAALGIAQSVIDATRKALLESPNALAPKLAALLEGAKPETGPGGVAMIRLDGNIAAKINGLGIEGLGVTAQGGNINVKYEGKAVVLTGGERGAAVPVDTVQALLSVVDQAVKEKSVKESPDTKRNAATAKPADKGAATGTAGGTSV